MSYELTKILNRCTKADTDFLISIIDSYVNFSDDKALKEMNNAWNGEGIIPLQLNHKIETEIRYLGSNDVAYLTRKLRGYVPAGVGVDEIIDDLCHLLKLQITTARTLEARLEIFAGKVVDQQFSKLSPEQQWEILNKMPFDEHHRKEVYNKIIKNKEILLAILLPLFGKSGAEVLQALILLILKNLIGKEAAALLLKTIATKLPAGGPWLGPALAAGWTLYDMTGPASRKTIPLILYLGILCLRDGETKEFTESLQF